MQRQNNKQTEQMSIYKTFPLVHLKGLVSHIFRWSITICFIVFTHKATVYWSCTDNTHFWSSWL